MKKYILALGLISLIFGLGCNKKTVDNIGKIENSNKTVTYELKDKLIEKINFNLVDFKKPKSGDSIFRNSKIASDLPFTFYNTITEEISNTSFVYWNYKNNDEIEHLGTSTDKDTKFDSDKTYTMTLFIKPKEGYRMYNNNRVGEENFGKDYIFNGVPCSHIFHIDEIGVYSLDFIFD